MRSAKHLLTAKIPNIELDVAMLRRPALHFDLLMQIDSRRSSFARIARFVVDQIAQKRGLADRLIADDEELDLIDRLRRPFFSRPFKVAVGGENDLGVTPLQSFLRQQAAEVAVIAQDKFAQSGAVRARRPGVEKRLGASAPMLLRRRSRDVRPVSEAAMALAPSSPMLLSQSLRDVRPAIYAAMAFGALGADGVVA